MKPPYVIVTCGIDQTRGWRWWPDDGGVPEVEIEPEDVITKLDLRWAYGLTLAIIGETENRVLEFFDSVAQVKPEKCFALMNFDNTVLESE